MSTMTCYIVTNHDTGFVSHLTATTPDMAEWLAVVRIEQSTQVGRVNATADPCNSGVECHVFKALVTERHGRPLTPLTEVHL